MSELEKLQQDLAGMRQYVALVSAKYLIAELAIGALIGAHTRPKKALRYWEDATLELADSVFDPAGSLIQQEMVGDALAMWSGLFRQAAGVSE